MKRIDEFMDRREGDLVPDPPLDVLRPEVVDIRPKTSSADIGVGILKGFWLIVLSIIAIIIGLIVLSAVMSGMARAERQARIELSEKNKLAGEFMDLFKPADKGDYNSFKALVRFIEDNPEIGDTTKFSLK